MSVVAAAIWLTAAAAAAQPMIRQPGPREQVDVVEHVDVLPDYMAQTKDAIARYIAAARREPGALRIDAVQEVRQNHFDIVETWRDEADYRAHQSSPATLDSSALSPPGSAVPSTSGSARRSRLDRRHQSRNGLRPPPAAEAVL